MFINPRSTLHCNFLFMFVFCLVVLNNSKRLMSHESQSPRLEALLFYSAVPTYTNSGICREIGLFFRLGDPNDANSNTKIENGKDVAKIREVQVNHSEKKHFRDDTSFHAKHANISTKYILKNKSSSPTSRLLRLFEI